MNDAPKQTPLMEVQHRQIVRLSHLNFYCLTLALIAISASGIASDYTFDAVILFSGSIVCLLSAWFNLRRVTLFKTSEHVPPYQMMFHFISSLFFFYIIIYKGLWRFVELRHGFALGVVISGILYIAVDFYAKARWRDLIGFSIRVLS